MKKYKILISYASWGKKYYENLLLSFESIINDLEDLKSNQYTDLFLNLYLDKTSKKKIIRHKNYNKIINCFKIIKIILIDSILKSNKKNNMRINLIQEKIIKESLSYDYLGLFYPDFLFSRGSLKNHVKKITEGKELTLSPVICLNYENVINKIKELIIEDGCLVHNKFNKIIYENIHNIQKFFILSPLTKILFSLNFSTTRRFERFFFLKSKIISHLASLIPPIKFMLFSITFIDGLLKKFPLSPAWLILPTNKKNLYFKCFHNSPIFIKTSNLSLNEIRIFISIDEDFIEKLYNKIDKKNIYFFSKSSQSLIISTKSINDPPNDEIVKDLQGDIIQSSLWVKENTNLFHKESIKHGYLLEINGSESNKINDQFSNRYISILLNK